MAGAEYGCGEVAPGCPPAHAHARRAGNARDDAESRGCLPSAAQAHERRAPHPEGGHAGGARRWPMEEGRVRLDRVSGVEQLPWREEHRHDACHVSHRELEFAGEAEDEQSRGELHTLEPVSKPCQARVLPANSPTWSSARKTLVTWDGPAAPSGAPRSRSPAIGFETSSSLILEAIGPGSPTRIPGPLGRCATVRRYFRPRGNSSPFFV